MNDNMDDKSKELLMTEVKAMEKINHPNVVNQIEYGVDTYTKSSKSKTVDYIVLELANGGELFDFIAISGRFEEPLARFYFKQFMDGLNHCHEAGITHRDLKPENLLLDNKYTLKIADFGFAAPIEGRDGSGDLTTKLGTLNYMAPEIHLKMPYQGASVDIFAAAIILFIMVAQHPPFTTAQPQDPFYKCIAANRSDVFWKIHSKNKPGTSSFFSKEFQDIIEKMMSLDPKNRPTIADIMQHPWMQGETPTAEQVFTEFQQREQSVKASMEADRAEKELEKKKRMADYGTRRGVNRATGVAVDPEEIAKQLQKPSKALDQYEQVFSTNTEFFSTYNPDMIEEALLEHLKTENVEAKVSKNKYKVKFTLTTKDQGGQVQNIEICMRILLVTDDKYCVEFQRLSGDVIRFHEHFNEFINKEKAGPLAAHKDAVLA